MQTGTRASLDAGAQTGVLASFAAAFSIDRAGLRPAVALKATAGVVIPLIAGIAAGYPLVGATAAFGALSVGYPLVTSGPRTPFGTMLAISLGMGTATFVGAVSGLVPAVHLLVLAAAGFVAGLLVAAGRGATQVGINATIALLVFGRFTAYPGSAATHASWVLAGGLFQTLLAVLAKSPRPLRSQRAALADAYEVLAEAAADGEQVPIAVAESAATAREAIRPWLQADDRPMAGPLRGLADELDRIRHEVQALRFQQPQLPPASCRLTSEAVTVAAGALRAISEALREGRTATSVDPLAEQLAELADQLAPDAAGRAGQGAASRAPGPAGVELPGGRFSSARAAAMAGQLRAVNRMVTELSGVRRISLPVTAANAADAMIVLPSGLVSVFRQVRAALSPSSPAFRHAVRLAVVIPLATAISFVLPWQRGYWLPLSALIVLKPDFAATISRGVARIIGTGIGVLAGAAIVATLHPAGLTLIALIAVCTWAGYTVFAANYAIFAIFLTAFVILLTSAGEDSALATVENRGFDTLIGGGLAILAYLLWPTWEAGTLQAATADRFEAIRRYLSAVLNAYLDPEAGDPAALERLAGATRRAQSSVAASLTRGRGDPARSRPDIGSYAGILSAGRRIVAGTHALASHLRDARQQVAVPLAAPIVSEIDQAMSELVRSIRTGEPPRQFPDLRRAHRRLTVDTAQGQALADRRGAIMVALLDPLVDAIDTAADLLSGSASGQLSNSGGPSPLLLARRWPTAVAGDARRRAEEPRAGRGGNSPGCRTR